MRREGNFLSRLPKTRINFHRRLKITARHIIFSTGKKKVASFQQKHNHHNKRDTDTKKGTKRGNEAERKLK